MKFQPESLESLSAIHRFGPEGLTLGQTRYTEPVVFGAELPPRTWPVGNCTHIEQADVEWLCRHIPANTEVLLMGTGPTLRFPERNTRQWLASQNIAIEWMDNAACARTYNVLLLEGRRVCAAMLLVRPNA